VTKKKDPNLLPLRVHKDTQQAYVLIDGARHYLGRNGMPETQTRYDKFLMEWLAAGRRMQVSQSDVTIVEVVAAFKSYVEQTYEDERTVQRFKSAWEPLVYLYGQTAAAEFGPLKLKGVRERVIVGKRGIRTRQYVNTFHCLGLSYRLGPGRRMLVTSRRPTYSMHAASNETNIHHNN
jgi:hypothetical protein